MVHSIALSQQTVVFVSLITVAATVIGTYIYKKITQPTFPTEWRAVGTVKELCIYPLKSGRKMVVEKANCTERGLMEIEKFDKSFRLRDRLFVAYQEKTYEYKTLRQFPNMTLIDVRAHDMNCVTLNGPGMKTLFLRIPSKEENPKVLVKHFKNEEIASIDCGDEAAAWISRYCLKKDSGLRLGYHDGSFRRDQIPKIYKAHNDFYKGNLRAESTGLNSDVSAVHIVNQMSVLDINQKMGDSTITSDNFRGNILVDGAGLEPLEEDEWKWVKVGDVVMKNVMECVRCMIPTVDAQSGVRRLDREPLRTLEQYRISKGPQKSAVMGIYLEVFETGRIHVGDIVYVSK